MSLDGNAGSKPSKVVMRKLQLTNLCYFGLSDSYYSLKPKSLDTKLFVLSNNDKHKPQNMILELLLPFQLLDLLCPHLLMGPNI